MNNDGDAGPPERRCRVIQSILLKALTLAPFMLCPDAIEAATLDLRTAECGVTVLEGHSVSPEQFLGRNITPRSDLYSLASSLYTLIVGRSPYETDGHDSAAAFMRRIDQQARIL